MSSVEAEDEVVELCSELIRIDTSNTGELETTVGEREAADYVAAKLAEVGIEFERVESGAPGRDNVICRLRGADPERGALLVHGHLDVVPADPSEWSVHPFSGAVQDGYVWGRGAVDMKDMVAMTLAVAPPLQARRGGAAARHRVRLPRRRGGGRGVRGEVARRAPARPVRRLHRGRRRGRRVLADPRRGPARLPDRVGREGHRLDAAAGPRQARARLVPARRQRGHQGGRGRRAAGQPHVPARRSPTPSAPSWPG